MSVAQQPRLGAPVSPPPFRSVPASLGHELLVYEFEKLGEDGAGCVRQPHAISARSRPSNAGTKTTPARFTLKPSSATRR
jgi:hypothetical protein